MWLIENVYSISCLICFQKSPSLRVFNFERKLYSCLFNEEYSCPKCFRDKLLDKWAPLYVIFLNINALPLHITNNFHYFPVVLLELTAGNFFALIIHFRSKSAKNDEKRNFSVLFGIMLVSWGESCFDLRSKIDH